MQLLSFFPDAEHAGVKEVPAVQVWGKLQRSVNESIFFEPFFFPFIYNCRNRH
jgi:hypothetical protein